MAYILIGTIIWGIVWGIVVNKVIENKGYEENWFWWGFFFGIFALIIALTKQSVNTTKVVIEGSTQVEEGNMETVSNNTLFEKVDICSPVHISSWDIKKDNNLNMALFVDFLNVSDKTISAVMFSTIGFNSFGDKVCIDDKESFDIIGQDLNIEPGEYGKVNVTIQNKEIRKVDVKVIKVCFVDGTIIEKTTSKWIDANQNSLSTQHLDCARRKNPHAKFYATGDEKFWQCTCGFVNTTDKCKLCNIEKEIALEFTKYNIEDTYQMYLEELELEKSAEEKRRTEEEKRLEEENIRKEREKQENIKRCVILGSVAIVIIIGISVFNYFAKENRYKNERVLISDYMYKNEYDNAYSVMISSDSYEKLKNEYGTSLWSKQKELDERFKSQSWEFAWEEDDLIYNEKLARNNICYYEIKEETEYGTRVHMYAISKGGEKQILLSEYLYEEDGYVYITGLGYNSWDDYNYSTIWSNGWLFISVSEKDVLRDEHQYALKYDIEEKRTYKVELSDSIGWGYDYAKMKDGNILISSEPIDDIRKAEVIKIFDVVDGTVKELNYGQVSRMYDNDIKGNILTIFE